MFRSALDKENFQAKITVAADKAVIKTTQIPTNVCQTPETLNLFKGETEVDCAYIKLAYKQMCEEYVKWFQEQQ